MKIIFKKRDTSTSFVHLFAIKFAMFFKVLHEHYTNCLSAFTINESTPSLVLSGIDDS